MNIAKKTYSNQEIAEIFQNIATAYEIKKKNRFRIISYQNAADNFLTFPQSIQQVWQQDKQELDNIPGVGEAIMKKLDYLFSKNKLHPHIIDAYKGIHPAVFTLTKINGIGPIIAHKLTQYFKFPHNPVKTLEKLIVYCQKGKIRNLETFGEKSEKMILENTLNYLGKNHRMSWEEANKIATNIIKFLQKSFPKVEFIVLGSLRRRSPTVGDIDIAAKNDQSSPIIDYFLTYPQIVQVINQGDKKASVKVSGNIRIDLMVQPTIRFGALLVHFTGSRQHNILLRRYANTLGYSISEYGIKNLKTGTLHSFSDEQSFYHFLKLKFIPPENRLGEKEIEMARVL